MSRSVKRARQTGVIHEPASARVLGCIKMVCPWEVSFNFYFFFLILNFAFSKQNFEKGSFEVLSLIIYFY